MNEADWVTAGKILASVVAFLTAWTILARWGIPLFRSFIFKVLNDKEGLAVLRTLVDQAYDDRIEAGNTVAEAVDDLLGRMDATELAVEAHTVEMKAVKAATDQVPELTRILTEIKNNNQAFAARFDDSMRQFTEELTKVREGVSRMEGRWDGIERRKNQ